MKQSITKAGYRLLKEEFENLKSVERPKVVNEVAEAAAQGDRSENAEYIYGKKRLREIDRRMGFLSKCFKNLQIVEIKDHGAKVFFGAKVTVYDEGKDREFVYRIVGPLDVLDGENISYQSPIGTALLGRSVDDEISVPTPKGVRELTIVDVTYDPDE